ncbi:hypothetical protein FXO37_25287 [Capsicum annuum]|nr:hypothetical protein FXO37_25287 [Capsicum annuum]
MALVEAVKAEPLKVLENDEEVEFVWGRKRGLGGKRKEVQFYESFTYDGMEYALYDCVYMHKEGELPYIGKIIKIWENPDKSRKIKIHWFFRPSEILYHLKDVQVAENEVFLASGEGTGLANVNSLWLMWWTMNNQAVIADDDKVDDPVTIMAVRPAMLYGAKCWLVKNSHIQKLKVVEIRVLRPMCGLTRRDKVRNEIIREKMRVTSVEDKMREVRVAEEPGSSLRMWNHKLTVGIRVVVSKDSPGPSFLHPERKHLTYSLIVKRLQRKLNAQIVSIRYGHGTKFENAY